MDVIQVIANSSYKLFNYIIVRIGYLFYLVNPKDCMQKNVWSVPRYVEEVFKIEIQRYQYIKKVTNLHFFFFLCKMLPVFIALGVAENFVRLVKGKPILRTNDTIASISQGIFQECVRSDSLHIKY